MNLQHLLYFKAVAECLSFSKAAKTLYVSQPNITYAIKSIEDELGTELFSRLGRSIRLTPAGSVYLSYIKQIFDLLEVAKSEAASAANTAGGNVSLSYMASMNDYAPYLISLFQQSTPDVSVHFQMSQYPALQIEDAVLRGECDLGIVSKTQNAKLERQTLGNHETVLICHSASKFAKEKIASIAELEGQPFVAYDKGCLIRSYVDGILAKYNVKPKITYEAAFDNLILGAVGNGIGVALVPRPTGSCPKNVVIVPIKEEIPERTIQLIWAKGRKLSPATELFRNYVTNNIDKLDLNKFIDNSN